MYFILGWSDWTAVWPVQSYSYHQHSIPHLHYYLTQLVSQWTMGTPHGTHMARWYDLALRYPATLWVALIICGKDKAEVMWFCSYNHDCLSFAVAVLYYYHYKRSMLRISDPRFYKDFNWVNHQHDGSWDPNLRYTHTHTHTHVYIYIYIVWFGFLVTKNLVSFLVSVLGTENS